MVICTEDYHLSKIKIPKWLRRFQWFWIVSGLTAGNEEMQVNTLIYCMGDKADNILRSFPQPTQECNLQMQ